MSHIGDVSIKFHALLLALDEAAAEQVRAARCLRCEGPLHRSKIPRKVRGLSDAAVEAGGYESRFSFCCGRDGCRRRATPPSARFSCGRVYAALAVLVLSLSGPQRTPALDLADIVVSRGAPARSTRGRWLRWWREELPVVPWFDLARGQHPHPAPYAAFPGSLLEMFAGTIGDQLTSLLRWLSPLTTGSVPHEKSREMMAR